MKNSIRQYKIHFKDKHYLLSLIISLVILAAGFIINIYAVEYATRSASSPVTDLILSNIRVYDVDGIFVNGAMLMTLFIAFVCLYDPKRIPFTVKTIALFIIIRSLFIVLTHIGAFPEHMIINPSSQNFIQDIIGTNLYESLFLGNDSFFSGHTGLPFLMALLYWDKKWIRTIFILLSIMFGIVVLLAHVHYTIDVLSAFFIVHGIYRISQIIFHRDYEISVSS